MSKPEIQGFIETARRFVKLEVSPMVGTEGRDGNLSKLPQIVESAASIGLTASADPQSPGYECGIWGKACLTESPAASVAILEEVAAACAGVAACLHFSSLAALELDGMPNPPRDAAVAFFEDSFPLTAETISKPAKDAVKIASENGQLLLSGTKVLVPSSPNCPGYLVYASDRSGWRRVLVAANARGLSIEDSGYRTGLAALKIASLKFDRVAVDAKFALPAKDPSAFLRRLFLGLAAIAAGNARGAVEAAAAYAAERYQGLSKIANHPAVKIMLGDAASRVSAGHAHLTAVCEEDRDDFDSLIRAAAAKLRICVDCWQAVTDSLQVLGGYGYMEDYRMEKRLRDAMTLKVMCGKPDELKMFCSTKLTGGV